MIVISKNYLVGLQPLYILIKTSDIFCLRFIISLLELVICIDIYREVFVVENK